MATLKSASKKKVSAKRAAVKQAAVKKAAPRKSATPVSQKTPTPRGRAQDRRLVAGKQKHEVAYEAKKQDVSPGIVSEVVGAVGHARQKVEATIQSFVKERKPAAKRKSKP